MIYEYAVDPALFTSEEKASFILEAFGLEKGRLISENKKKHWGKLVKDAIRSSGNKQIKGHYLKELLVNLTRKQKGIYCRQIPVEEGDWWSQTEQAHAAWPYRGILVEEYDGSQNFFLVRDTTLSENKNWQVPLSVTVEREPEKIVEAVSPLLENAREVMLVDRHFRLVNSNNHPIDKYKNVLICFLEFLANKKYGPKVSKLTYHIGQSQINEITPSVISHIEHQCVQHLKKNIPPGINLEVAVWPWDSLHDRFLLTEIGLIDCGIGLDEFAGSNEKNVRLKRLGVDDHKELWPKFKQKQPDITLP